MTAIFSLLFTLNGIGCMFLGSAVKQTWLQLETFGGGYEPVSQHIYSSNQKRQLRNWQERNLQLDKPLFSLFSIFCTTIRRVWPKTLSSSKASDCAAH